MKKPEQFLMKETVRCVGGPRDGYTMQIGPEVKLRDIVKVAKVPQLPVMDIDFNAPPQLMASVQWYDYVLDEICKSEQSDVNPRSHVSVPIVRFLRYAEISADEAIRHQFRK